MGRLYYGDLQEAREHYKKTYGVEPIVIYCNSDEFEDADLERIEMNFPKNNFVLSHERSENG